MSGLGEKKNMKKNIFHKRFFSADAPNKKCEYHYKHDENGGAVALHNYHNAHENKRLVSQRTSKLTWCQLVTEADHALPFQRKGKTERGRERHILTEKEV